MQRLHCAHPTLQGAFEQESSLVTAFFLLQPVLPTRGGASEAGWRSNNGHQQGAPKPQPTGQARVCWGLRGFWVGGG